MLFYIFIAIGVIIFIVGSIKSLSSLYTIEGFVLTCILSAPFIVAPSISWTHHANDLSNIKNQHLNIAEYQKRVDSLQDRLNNFDYPKGALMNADTPVATIVRLLAGAESKLLTAKESKIESIKSVDARKLGVMSGVVGFVGDYDEEIKLN